MSNSTLQTESGECRQISGRTGMEEYTLLYHLLHQEPHVLDTGPGTVGSGFLLMETLESCLSFVVTTLWFVWLCSGF